MSSNPTRVLSIADEPLTNGPPGDHSDDLGLDWVDVRDPQEAKRLLAENHFDVLVVEFTGNEAGRLDLLEYARKASPDCRIILVSSVSIPRRIARAFALGATDYVQKPLSQEELARSISRVTTGQADQDPSSPRPFALKLQSQRKQDALEGIHALVCAVEAKDPYTRRHSEQVAHYTSRLAERLGLAADVVESLSVASLVHDVGKIGVPDRVLTKRGKLTEKEMARVRLHPGLGEYIIRNLSVFDAEARIVRYHHENWDGSGYPDGLSGDQIPLGSRLIRVADSMDAMLMQRSYKNAYAIDTMLGELRRCAGRDFDPAAATAAVEWSGLRPEELILPTPAGAPAVTRSA